MGLMYDNKQDRRSRVELRVVEGRSWRWVWFGGGARGKERRLASEDDLRPSGPVLRNNKYCGFPFELMVILNAIVANTSK